MTVLSKSIFIKFRVCDYNTEEILIYGISERDMEMYI